MACAQNITFIETPKQLVQFDAILFCVYTSLQYIVLNGALFLLV